MTAISTRSSGVPKPPAWRGVLAPGVGVGAPGGCRPPDPRCRPERPRPQAPDRLIDTPLAEWSEVVLQARRREALRLDASQESDRRLREVGLLEAGEDVTRSQASGVGLPAEDDGRDPAVGGGVQRGGVV